MFDSFAIYLREKGQLTTGELEQVEQLVKPLKVRRRPYLLQAHDISNYIGFVVKGIDALEDSELLMIEKENFDMMIDTIPNFKSMIDRLGAKNFEMHQARIYAAINESAEVQAPYINVELVLFYNNFCEFHMQDRLE